jgi:hypothetical protein
LTAAHRSTRLPTGLPGRTLRVAAVLALALVAAACATTAPDPAAAAAPAGRARLDAGVASYEQGRFEEAIELLSGSTEIDAAPPAVRIEALKTLAFSQCVTGRSAPCRRSFDAMLEIDAAFALSAAESGHPAWGPVFDQARRAVAGPAAATGPVQAAAPAGAGAVTPAVPPAVPVAARIAPPMPATTPARRRQAAQTAAHTARAATPPRAAAAGRSSATPGAYTGSAAARAPAAVAVGMPATAATLR